MIKTILLFFLVAIVPFSQTSHMGYTEILSKFFTKYPGTYVAVPSFSKQKKLIIDNHALFKYYLKHSQSGDIVHYQDYLNAVIEKGVSFDIQDIKSDEYKFSHHFISDKLDILREYQSKGINFIITKYLTKLDKGQFRNKVMDDNTLYGLIYIMSANKYIASFSDYSGYFQFMMVEEVSERIKRANKPE